MKVSVNIYSDSSWEPCTGSQVLKKRFITMYSEDCQAISGRVVVLFEHVLIEGQAFLCRHKSVADWNVICTLKIEMLI